MLRRIRYWLRFQQRAYERGYVDGFDAAEGLEFMHVMQVFEDAKYAEST